MSVLARNDVFELLELAAIQRSALALLVASAGLPVVGVLIIGLDVVPARFAVMHTALLGIALGLWLGVDPQLSALVVSTAAMLAVAPLADRPGGLGGPMGLIMTIAIAGALLVLSISGVNANGAFELLWGSILATRTSDLLLLTALAVGVFTFVIATRTPLALALFDRDLARCSGVAVGVLTTACLGITGLAVASSIRLTGALLVDAVTLLPALAARNLARSFGTMVVWAVAVGVLGNSTGFLLALWLDQPPGPFLVLTTAALVGVSYLTPATRRT